MSHQGPFTARRLLLAAIAIGLVAGAWRAGASGAAPKAPPAASTVAVVDFPRAYEALKEIADRSAKITEQGTKFEAEVKELSKKVADIQIDVQNTKPMSKEWFELRMAQKEAQDRLESRRNGITNRLRFTFGNNNREIYLKFVGTVEFLAQREGWDLVLLDDRTLRVPEFASAEEVTDTITRKNILYAGQRIDITDLVITQMNNDYGARPPVDRTPPLPQVPTAKQ